MLQQQTPNYRPLDGQCVTLVITRIVWELLQMDVRRLYYSNVYGMTFLSARDTWPAARAEYVARITRPLPEGADAFARTRQANFQKEAAVLTRWDGMASLPAVELRFSLDPETRRLELILGVAA